MNKFTIYLLVLTTLSANAFAQTMKCVDGELELNFSNSLSRIETKDKVLTAKGKFTHYTTVANPTRIVFGNGKVRFVPSSSMPFKTTTHDIDFTSTIEHMTSSTDGEWSSYKVDAGLFIDSDRPTYIQVNNIKKTATIYKSEEVEADTWECI